IHQEHGTDYHLLLLTIVVTQLLSTLMSQHLPTQVDYYAGRVQTHHRPSVFSLLDLWKMQSSHFALRQVDRQSVVTGRCASVGHRNVTGVQTCALPIYSSGTRN